MTKSEIYSKILDISEKSYYRWKAKDHKTLVSLIEKYFTDKELEEFLNTGRIKRFEAKQNNNYLLNKSIKLYKIINYKLTPKAKKIFFEELKNLKSYKIEDISNIIFYLIKNEDFDSKNNYIKGISEMSIRLDLFNLFQKIDEFELEYFITNFEEIKLHSNNTSITNKKIIHKGIYGIEKSNINEFEKKFFKIEENHFIKIKTIEENDDDFHILILFDIVTPIYTKSLSIEDFKVIETDKKLVLTINEYDIFSTLILKMTDMKFF
ncbi:hypothetical protein [Aliarcobacter butzleri]|uniref:hypothetical protein n=1 Tax=Aliarcobacter butzleri TaxID=28197 RepID=UPI002B254201|nr:hypothetical protein [Aliarcobacter butzleri]